jgi:anthranilate phosphoribosyltransferase
MSSAPITDAIAQLLDHENLQADTTAAVMRQIMSGEATPAQIAGFLIALRMKGETVMEITVAARVMREFSAKLVLPAKLQAELIDTCGTGGDGSSLFNVSTASAIACAAAGAKVAKHGNRSVSSMSGSADVLTEAGVEVGLSPEQVAECVAELGIGFLFAPTFHPAMKHALGPRKELGVRTIFNLLGPLTNPAGAQRQVLGVFAAQWVEPMAQVLGNLGCKHVMVVYGEDGLDEVSMSAGTQVAEWRVQPQDFGLNRCDRKELQVVDARESLQMIRWAFAGERGPAADMIALNGGAALYVAGLVNDWEAGVRCIEQVLQSGAAADKLAALVTKTRALVAA